MKLHVPRCLARLPLGLPSESLPYSVLVGSGDGLRTDITLEDEAEVGSGEIGKKLVTLPEGDGREAPISEEEGKMIRLRAAHMSSRLPLVKLN